MEPDEDIRQPLRSRKGFAISTKDRYPVTTLWSQGSGTRFPPPRVHQIGAHASTSGRPLRSEDLAHSATPNPDPASLRQRFIGTRRHAEQDWARLISQSHCTTVHTLRGAVLYNHPDILQRHRQYYRRLSSFHTHQNGKPVWVDVSHKAR